jgi:hypothetical protein
MTCIHRSANAWTCRTSVRTLSSRCSFTHHVARTWGPRASLSTMRSIRPDRAQKVGLTFLVLRETQCRERCQDCKRSALGQRIGYTCRLVGVCHTVWGPWVLKRGQAQRARGAVEGVEPFFLACVFARRLRSWTRHAGRRDATRRQATGSWAPRNRACAVLSPATVVSQEARARGCPCPEAVGTRVVC